jgi:hypothetical protein
MKNSSIGRVFDARFDDTIARGQDDGVTRSYKVVVTGSPNAEAVANRVRFGRHEEAQMYLFDLVARWRRIKEIRIVPSADQITDAWINQRLVPVKPGDVA